MGKTHGMTSTPEFQAWSGMKERCTQTATYHKYYYDRGITVFPPWQRSLLLFLAHIGPMPSLYHTIDRLDNNLGYVPGNVRWATPKQQGRNKRNNRLVEFEGRTLPLSEWAEVTGIPYQTLYARLSSGYSPDRLFSREGFKGKPLAMGDVSLTAKEWAEVYGVNYYTLQSRLKRGLPLRESLGL